MLTPYPVIVGALAATGTFFGIHEAVKRRIKRFLRSGQKKSPRIRAKMETLLGNVLDNLPGKKRLQTMKELFRPIKKYTLSLAKDFSTMMHPSAVIKSHPSMTEDVETVLNHCSFQRPIPFWLAIPHWKQVKSKKLSEGSYGEVFRSIRFGGTPVIIKTFPVGGQHPNKRTPNLTFRDITSEVICSIYLSKLNNSSDTEKFTSPNFPKCHKISCVQGNYPHLLFRAWSEYSLHSSDPTEHPRPDLYSEGQLVMAIESEFCGEHISFSNLRSALSGLSLFTQVAVSLAIAEKAYQFEHRDLHSANILVQETESEFMNYSIDGIKFDVVSCGIRATIIDFTLSRICTEEGVFYVDMSGSAWYRSEGDNSGPRSCWLDNRYVYKQMADTSEDAWADHHPYTNILWLRYLIERVLDLLRNRLNVELLEGGILEMLRNYRDTVLNYSSASTFTYNRLFGDNILLTVHR